MPGPFPALPISKKALGNEVVGDQQVHFRIEKLNYFTMTFRVLGRNHVASIPFASRPLAIQVLSKQVLSSWIPLVRYSAETVIN